MQRSQVTSCYCLAPDNWNTIWKNYFLDYTSSLKICYDIKAKVKLIAFVKWSNRNLLMLFWLFLLPDLLLAGLPVWFRFRAKSKSSVDVKCDFRLWMVPMFSKHILLSVVCIFAVILNMDFKVKVDSKIPGCKCPCVLCLAKHQSVHKCNRYRNINACYNRA